MNSGHPIVIPQTRQTLRWVWSHPDSRLGKYLKGGLLDFVFIQSVALLLLAAIAGVVTEKMSASATQIFFASVVASVIISLVLNISFTLASFRSVVLDECRRLIAAHPEQWHSFVCAEVLSRQTPPRPQPLRRPRL